MEGTEQFDLGQTSTAVGNALLAVVCRIGFEASIHGFCLAALVLLVALFCAGRKHRYAKPLFSVARKIGIFCAILAIPGTICLLTQKSLPDLNGLQLSSVGLIGFWSLVTLHLCMEEMNFQLFQQRPKSKA